MIISDAFIDFYQIDRNSKLIDKTEIYLYFYELSIGKETFPLFYLPVTLHKREDKFVLQFEKRVFVNIKAVDYVVQESNIQTQNKSTLSGQFDRILYIDNDRDFSLILKNIINKIEDFFTLNKSMDLHNSELQKHNNLIISFSNKSYLFLFDKSDEALINDYEEILNDEGDILEDFSSLINSFIEDEPISVIENVTDEWHYKKISKKLTVESPIPLNDEQKQVLVALQKP
ncbi:MAG: hypothetical protein QQN41_12560, partial [Nitrosopumilus sp.]